MYTTEELQRIGQEHSKALKYVTNFCEEFIRLTGISDRTYVSSVTLDDTQVTLYLAGSTVRSRMFCIPLKDIAGGPELLAKQYTEYAIEQEKREKLEKEEKAFKRDLEQLKMLKQKYEQQVSNGE